MGSALASARDRTADPMAAMGGHGRRWDKLGSVAAVRLDGVEGEAWTLAGRRPCCQEASRGDLIGKRHVRAAAASSGA